MRNYFGLIQRLGTIVAMKRDLSERKVIIDVTGNQVENIAIDWITDNIYWTSPKTKTIEVARLDGSHRYVLIYESLDNPKAIAVDPRLGYLFWTDNDDITRIERAMLDGSDRRVIYSGFNLGLYTDLVIDYIKNKLYWCDQYNSVIMRSNYDGNNVESIGGLSIQMIQPYSIDFKDDEIFWVEK